MAKKKPDSEKRRTVIQLRCTDADVKAFRAAVEATGHVSLTSWILFTLRNAARESSRPE